MILAIVSPQCGLWCILLNIYTTSPRAKLGIGLAHCTRSGHFVGKGYCNQFSNPPS